MLTMLQLKPSHLCLCGSLCHMHPWMHVCVCVHMWPLDGRMQLYCITEASSSCVCESLCPTGFIIAVTPTKPDLWCPRKTDESLLETAQLRSKIYTAPHAAHIFSPSQTFFFCQSPSDLSPSDVHTHMQDWERGWAFITQCENTWHTFKLP